MWSLTGPTRSLSTDDSYKLLTNLWWGIARLIHTAKPAASHLFLHLHLVIKANTGATAGSTTRRYMPSRTKMCERALSSMKSRRTQSWWSCQCRRQTLSIKTSRCRFNLKHTSCSICGQALLQNGRQTAVDLGCILQCCKAGLQKQANCRLCSSDSRTALAAGQAASQCPASAQALLSACIGSSSDHVS